MAKNERVGGRGIYRGMRWLDSGGPGRILETANRGIDRGSGVGGCEIRQGLGRAGIGWAGLISGGLFILSLSSYLANTI